MRGARTQKALQGVSVLLRVPAKDWSRSALSDAAGTYRFTDLPCGSYELGFFYGSDMQRMNITVNHGGVRAPTQQLADAP